MPLTLTTDAFWQFSLNHYQQCGVEAACLSLQNQYQGNVNLALLLHWLDGHQLQLPESSTASFHSVLADSESLLFAYRTMRRQLKPQLDTCGYKQLLQFELTLEQQQQHTLIEHLKAQSLTPATSAANLDHYCQHLHAPTSLCRQLQGIA